MSARIDSQGGTLRRSTANERDDIFEQALGVGDRFVNDTEAMLLRVAMARQDCVVNEAPKRERDEAHDDDGKGGVNLNDGELELEM